MTSSHLFTIRLTHPYYNNQKPRCLDLYPADQSSQLFLRRSVIFRKTDVNTWSINHVAHESNETPFADKDQIDLFLRNTDRDFQGITDLPGYLPKTNYELTLPPGKKIVTLGDFQILPKSDQIPPRILLHLVLPCIQGHIDSEYPPELEISFSAKVYFFEYLLIPRNNTISSRKLFIRDSNRKISFSPLEELTFMDQSAYRLKSLDKITVRENYPFYLDLVENTPFGERTIRRSIPFPIPGQFLSDTPDTLRNILYI